MKWSAAICAIFGILENSIIFVDPPKKRAFGFFPNIIGIPIFVGAGYCVQFLRRSIKYAITVEAAGIRDMHQSSTALVWQDVGQIAGCAGHGG